MTVVLFRKWKVSTSAALNSQLVTRGGITSPGQGSLIHYKKLQDSKARGSPLRSTISHGVHDYPRS